MLPVLAAAPARAASEQHRDERWNPPSLIQRDQTEPLPSLQQLEARGARVGRILVKVYEVFDPGDPRENKALYRAANKLHYKSREWIIAEQLTFREGDLLQGQRLEESERLLRHRQYLYDAIVRVADYDAGTNVADIEAIVRDVWTLNPGIAYSNRGGKDRSNIEIEDSNLFGRGNKFKLNYARDVDRTTKRISWTDPNVLGSRWDLATEYRDLSDGSAKYLEIERPFYSLDSRWSVGGSFLDDERLQTRYDLGKPVDVLRVNSQVTDLHFGWSKGLIDGWTRRWLVGVRSDEQGFLAEPGEIAPDSLPLDHKLIYPWVGIEWVQDAFSKTYNLDQIGRTEDLSLGTTLRASLGYANEALGSSHDAWIFSTDLVSQREYRTGRIWSIAANADGRVEAGKLEDAAVYAEARHYWRLDRRQTFFAGISGALAHNLDPDRQLVLGGEEGLRGFPLRYQTGTTSALLTLEHRIYTDWYPFRLFHVGGAVFFDVGRTWGPTVGGEPSRGWLSDAGLGFRLGNSRSGLGSITHIDFSYALNAIPGKDRFQITVETKRSF